MGKRMGEAFASADEHMVMGTHQRSGENAPDFSLVYLDLEEISILPSASLYQTSGLAIILAVPHMSLNVNQIP